jgi:hypothetical protein
VTPGLAVSGWIDLSVPQTAEGRTDLGGVHYSSGYRGERGTLQTGSSGENLRGERCMRTDLRPSIQLHKSSKAGQHCTHLLQLWALQAVVWVEVAYVESCSALHLC